MSLIQKHLAEVYDRIALSAKKNDRTADSITLVVVSKGRSCKEIQDVIDAGQRQFGENYLQEALPKIRFLNEKNRGNVALCWHFIGYLQSNKAKLVADNFDWVQSVDREKVALLLDRYRSKNLPPLNVCIEVNVSGEKRKSGVKPEMAANLAQMMQNLPNLRLRGLMVIPAPNKDYDEQRQVFHKVQQLFMQLNAQGFELDTLSIGMSDDFEAAIAQGATMLRIGSAIFN